MYQSHEFYLRRAIEISKEAREAGNTPFGALLVNKEERSSWSREILRLQRKSVQGTRKRHLQQEHLMNIPESFCGLYIIYDCRAMCDVCRSYLLGEYRKSCIRNDRETTVGADRK